MIHKDMFYEIVSQYPGSCKLALLCARQCVAELSQNKLRTDLHTFAGVDSGSDEGADKNRHLMFLSHYKVEAGTEATLMMEELSTMIKNDLFSQATIYDCPVFIDSESLHDLAELQDAVKISDYLVPLLTPGLLSRPWCLVEIVVAHRHNIDVVPVEVQRPGIKFEYPNDAFYEKLRAGQFLDDAAMKILSSQGIELHDLEDAIRRMFQKISKPFSPHKSGKVRIAELEDIVRLCPDKRLASKGSKAVQLTI